MFFAFIARQLQSHPQSTSEQSKPIVSMEQRPPGTDPDSNACTKFIAFPSSVGMEPGKAFSSSRNSSKRTRRPTSDAMDPTKKLDDMSKYSTDIRSPNSVGKVELSMLLFISNDVITDIVPISEGMGPDNELCTG